ncbi:peptidoglycan DD-metalloendopeptidase family protein [Acidihalobacter ferrooxydans]|uniref:LysM domain-containing protein n=1 Tax=Acidihalobacter ferrooxydans TaxID=1765967 RepID=A0A1P8UHY4_9GAMM|nr:peptidoglycan DD-metalloendopeptidase family protein [Acidihalobacter ferrooxydans]APZ43438.1 hypothetical protein BW247_10360 [Acidihalobacter ferrooxydans]
MRTWRNSLLCALCALGLAGCGTLPYTGARFDPGYYEVKPGETLYSIAWRFDLNYRSLARWNDISAPYTIYPGQRLRMNPPSGRTATAVRTPHSQPRAPAPRVQTAQRHTAPRKPAATSQPPVASGMHWIWPARGVLSAGFSKGPGGNQGIDISGKLGEPIVAALSGQVVYSGDGLPSYGNLLIIQHNSRYLTAYAHNRKLLVHEGDVVKQGQEIATMGRSGTDVTKPTLHFEIRVDGEPVNPLRYLPKQHKPG